MKFIELTIMLKKLEENKNALLLVRCGAFFVALDKDAIWLSINLGLKKTCLKNNLCKNGKVETDSTINITTCTKI